MALRHFHVQLLSVHQNEDVIRTGLFIDSNPNDHYFIDQEGDAQEFTQGLQVSSSENGDNIWPSKFWIVVNLISLSNFSNFIELSDCYQYDPSI